jgi:DNA-binding MarR family transcriptional regulator
MHLELVRKHHEDLVIEDRTYIRYAYMYGYTVSQIAEETGLTVPYVQRVLLGP